MSVRDLMPGETVRAGFREGMQAVWRVRRRIRRLEGELAEARAGQAELRRRLERFEMIAAAAGAAVDAPVPSVPLPLSLVAAARELHRQDVPVRLDIEGTEVIAVIDGHGDPHEWWEAMRQLAGPVRKTS
jgi:hypothetical protein